MDAAGRRGEGTARSTPGTDYSKLTGASYAGLAGVSPAGSEMGGSAGAGPSGMGGSAAMVAASEAAGTPDAPGPAEPVRVADPDQAAPGPEDGPRPGRPGGLAGHPVRQHLLVLAGFLLAGIAVSWPRASYLVTGKLPATRDAGAYVWGFWWIAHQAVHLGDPWLTHAIAAPVGVQLGLHALMPLPDLLLSPVTAVFGPSVAYNLLSALMPGLTGYAMYRAARLWLPSQTGAIAAGAFFGLSAMLVWRSWYHLNLAAGALFLPIALEAAIRLTRRPGWRSAVVLGVVLAAAVLTDQEISILVIILAVLTVVVWLLRRPYTLRKLALAGLAGAVALILASPQLVAIYHQIKAGGVGSTSSSLMMSYRDYSSSLPSMFAPSPRLRQLGLGGIGFIFRGPVNDGVPDFGLVLTAVALAGLALSWRRGSAWLLAALWLACAALALGPVLRVGSHLLIPAPQQMANWRLSGLMPFTWFAKIPALSGFREPDRMMMLGLVPAALLAGTLADWLSRRARLTVAVPVIAVVGVLGALEAGWSGNTTIGTVPTALPALDRPIAADHSSSIVVDVPFGIRGGTYTYGGAFDPDAQVLATADGHPRAVGYISRVPLPTIDAIDRHAFYSRLVAAQRREHNSPREFAAARRDLSHLDIGWIIVWNQWAPPNSHVTRYLRSLGFHVAYVADGATVWRHWPPGHHATS